MRRHRPSIEGCRGGFAAAGMGIGAALGMFFGSLMHETALSARMPEDERAALANAGALFVYATIGTGVLMGLLFGGITGTVYAVYKRRWLAVIDPKPHASAPEAVD